MAANDTNSIRKLLTTCCEIETLAGEFYRALARLHKHEPDAAALWLKTASEEDNHKLQFDLCQRLSVMIVSGAVLDQEKADRALQLLRGAIAKLETSAPTVPSALRFAINMETMMMEFHMEHAIVFTSKDYSKMFRAMMDQDCGHIQTLKDFLSRYEAGC